MRAVKKIPGKQLIILVCAGIGLAVFLVGFMETRRLDNMSISFVKSVALDEQSNFLVATNGCVRKFNAQGQVTSLWGSWECTTELFSKRSISKLVMDHEGNFYASINNGKGAGWQYQKLDKNGQVLFNLPGKFDNFSQGNEIAIDGSNNVYIPDFLNYRVLKFDSQGHLLAQIGSKGSGEGQFEETFHIAVDSQGNLYADDAKARTSDNSLRLQKFDSQGKYVGLIGQANITTQLNKNAAARDEISELNLMAVDSEGNLNVVAGFWNSYDYNFYLVKFSPTGQYLGKFELDHSYPAVDLLTGPGQGMFYLAFSEAPRGSDEIVLLDTNLHTKTTIIRSGLYYYIFPVCLMGGAILIEVFLLLISLSIAFTILAQKKPRNPSPLNSIRK